MNKRTDKVFFAKWQKQIVWLFNTSWGKWFFRIGEGYSSVEDKKIIKVLPNAIQWFEGYQLNEKGEWRIVKSTEFRTNNRFAYRMNTLLKYVPFIYWTENWYPALQFGLTVTTVYPDADPESTSVDGYVQYVDPPVGVTWATIHDATAGTSGGAGDSITNILAQVRAATTTDQWDILRRTFILFDTSGIDDTDEVSSATCSIWPLAGQQQNDFTSNLDLVTSTPASNTGLVIEDYDQVGTVLQGTSLALSGVTTGEYNDITLNATGLGNISLTGITKFGLRISQDTTNTEPAWVSAAQSVVGASAADTTGTSQDPKLVVTHSAPAPEPSVFDSVSITESVTVVAFPADLLIDVNDSITITEDVALDFIFAISVSDSITLTESVTVENTQLGDIDIFDAITVAEDVTAENEQLGDIDVSDSITISDVLTATLLLEVNVNDSVSISEDVDMSVDLGGIDVSDSVTITEAVTIVISAAREGMVFLRSGQQNYPISMDSQQQSYPLSMDNDEIN